MIRRRSHPEATQSTRRLEAFTDGVFAIAATLLVLDLTSHEIGKVSSDAGLISALLNEWGLLFNFVLSFVLLCLLWMTHADQFEYVIRVDGTGLWLNSIRLLFIVLVPFATGLTTEYSEFFAGRMAMPLVFFLAVSVSALQWGWAVRHRAEMLSADITDDDIRRGTMGGRSAVIIAAAVLALSPWVGSPAFALFFLDPLVTRLLAGRTRADR
jgi:uncharacterized membrane protein